MNTNPLASILKGASVHDFVVEHPEASLIPAGAIVGAHASRDRISDDKFRGIAHGTLTGLGAAAGGAIGRMTTPDNPATGLTLGIGAGGLLSYLASQKALDKLFPGRRERLQKDAAVLDDLKKVKLESDRKNYAAKHTQLRELIHKYPQDFTIDSRQGALVGITHVPTGFRFHAPQQMLPLNLQEASRATTPTA